MVTLAFRAGALGALGILDWLLGLGILHRPAPVLAPVRVGLPPYRRGAFVPPVRTAGGRVFHL